MKKDPKRKTKTRLVAGLSLVAAGVLVTLFLLGPSIKPWVKSLGREGRRILGLRTDVVPPGEKRIREEIVLKRMEDPDLYQDWRPFAPEYPRPKKPEGASEKDRIKILKALPEFKEMDQEVRDYLKKKEDLFGPVAPVPSIGETGELIPSKDPAAEKLVERLLSKKKALPPDRPLEENARLGINGPLASRRILERPRPPQVKVKVETEIELTFWALPNGIVDRAVPTVKGDAELEQAAIQYLKQWRFAPLSGDAPQTEQWGTIPIKFKLQ